VRPFHRIAQSPAFQTARARLEHTPELAQSLGRIIVTSLLAALLATMALLESSKLFENLALAFTLYFACSLLHFAWVAEHPGVSRVRRLLSIAADQAACTATILIGGERALPFAAFYVWVAVSSGVAYGAGYMQAATVLAAVGFVAAVSLVDLAQVNLTAVLAILLVIAGVPFFTRSFFLRVEAAHDLLREHAAQLRREATNDRLTGLVNRTVLLDRLGRIIARSDRRYVRCAVLYVDLDQFKRINETLGQAAGDACLAQIATRVAARIRRSDTFARIAEDEFALLVEEVGREDEAVKIADTVQGTIRAIASVEGQRVDLSASIGIALYPGAAHDVSAEDVLTRAEIAMHGAKQSGSGRCTFYSPALLVADIAGDEEEEVLPARSA
jgi:diguanylate cyclase (GGDEF)-like protein